MLKGINHVTLRVRSLEQSETFYCELLGFQRVGSRPGMGFYSSGQHNHELALVEDPVFTKSASGTSGFEHVAFTVENKRELAFLYQRVIDAEYPVSQGVDHVISQSFYVRDRDGYLVELTVDTPRCDWKQNPDAFRKDFPLDI